MSANKHFDDLDITRDEFERLKDAFKKDEFRKLFLDYCEEIQDPENRKQYEAEITQLEAERGVDVTFLNPEPGFVVKTSLNGEIKCFLNIAKCDKVAAPSNQRGVNPENGERALKWSIPHCLPPPRDDYDNKRVRCKVFDVLFHPDALHLAQKNSVFRKTLIDTACEGIEREYKVRLDRTNLKFPKLKFKGVQRASVIRKLSDNPPPPTDEPNPLDNIFPPKPEVNPKPKNVQCKSSVREEYCKPKYVIKHRRPVDMSEMTYELDAKVNLTIPKELVVEVDLPMLKSTADCTLDVTEKKLYLISEKPAKYKLNIELPYAVNDKDGSAKFEADKRKLIITLPVRMIGKERGMKDFYREDSGVESDVREEMHSSGGDSPVAELIQELDSSVTLDEDPKSSYSAAVMKHPTFFLKNSIQYTFPQHFDCNALDEVIAIVLHVRNVEKESIEHIKCEKFFHVKFTSIGAGYYPIHYAFYFEFPEEAEVKIDSIEAEAWDNNVVLSVNLKDFQNIESYFAGLDKTDMKEYKIQEKFITNTPKPTKSHEDQSQLEVSVERSEDEKSVEIEIKPKSLSDYNFGEEGDEDELKKHSSVSTSKKHKKKNKKRRSLSESSCDDIKQHRQKAAACAAKKNLQINKSEEINGNHANDDNNINSDSAAKNSSDSSPERMNADGGSNIQIPQSRKQRSYSESRDHSAPIFKGILKHYSRYARTISDSCSSIDEPSSYSCSIDGGLRFAQSFSDIPEENSPHQGLSESCKKTVRFNEVIKKQVFRLDSSILGQRKKNQKKKNKKQRALQRRHSEGDSADYEDNKSPNSHEQFLKQRGDGTKSSKHDSGLDLSTQDKNGNPPTPMRIRAESESSDLESKNTLMFDMDM